MFAVGIGFWFRNTGGQTDFLSVIVMRVLFACDPPFPETVFNDLEVVLERFGSLVRFLGRKDAGIICECG